MSVEWLPVIPLLIAAVLSPLAGVRGRQALSLAAPLAALALVLIAPPDGRVILNVLNLEWTVFQADAQGRVFAVAFCVFGFIAGLYAWRDTGAIPKLAAMLLTAGAVGVVQAGNMLALFVFWEMLTVASILLIWSGGTREALASGYRYAMFHLAGGTCMLAGIIMQMREGGLDLSPLALTAPGAWLILIGLCVNAAVVPLHAWLTDSYPNASIFGTVFLATYTTKAAVCILARLFPGAEVLMWAGAFMAIYGVVFAVLENDLRRLLSYHIVSQVGFMVCAVGMGSELAINGAVAHAICNIFCKGLLMMSAGSVLHATGRGKLSELGRLAGPMRWTMVMCAIGALSIAGAPLLNCFISKSLIISATALAHRPVIELMLLTASMGTCLSIALKLFWFTFMGTDHGATVIRPVSAPMMIAMVLAAGLCIVTGSFPELLYRQLPFIVEYHPYTADHIVGSFQLLMATTLGFIVLRSLLKPSAVITLDVDRLYRRPLALALDLPGQAARAAFSAIEALIRSPWPIVRDGLRVYHDFALNNPLAYRVAVVLIVLAGVGYLMIWLA